MSNKDIYRKKNKTERLNVYVKAAKTHATGALVYPEKDEPDFGERLMGLKEFRVYAVPPLSPIESAADYEKEVKRSNGQDGFEKAIYQHLVQHFMSRRSPYRSLLLYHFLGVGKSCSAITITEALLLDHREHEPPPIIVVTPAALRKNFEEQLFSVSKLMSSSTESIESLQNQCTGDTYARLVHGLKLTTKEHRATFLKRVQQIIKSRYMFVTYDGLINLAKLKPINDKVIVVDEAHNLRHNDASKEKESANALKHIIEHGSRNRLLLLSATPMYNEPDEIMWLLSLLLLNDKRVAEATKVEKMHLFVKSKSKGREDAIAEVRESFAALGKYSTEYISYIRGNNPFTFPARLRPTNQPMLTLSQSTSMYMRDGIVATVAGDMQRIPLVDAHATDPSGKEDGNGYGEMEPDEPDVGQKGSLVVGIQLSNITYPNNKTGKAGFNEVFSSIDANKPIQVTYNPTHAGLMSPSADKLGRIAAKIKKICELIGSSEGIVVVYSQFVWSGIVPCAIALEHMGFKRYGARNMLSSESTATSTYKQVVYPGVPAPTYCILSGSDAVMGSASTNIDSILPILNGPGNMYGEKIKVVLMTPVAGEGLSFKHVREMHVLDPWYHFNKIDQVVGRAIRTGSHKDLPQEERNVTVYLHACVTSPSNILTDTRISPDVHAYQISARKLYETEKAEETIRNSAIDCALLKNVNTYPSDLFKFSVAMRTSQKDVVVHKYGDDATGRARTIECTHDINTDIVDARTLRPGLFDTLVGTIRNRLAKYLKSQGRIMYPIKELVEALRIDEYIALLAIEQSLHPRTLMRGYRIFPHMNGIVVIPEDKPYRQKLVSIPQQQPQSVASDRDRDRDLGVDVGLGDVDANVGVGVDVDVSVNVIKSIALHASKGSDPYIGIYNAYLNIDSSTWTPCARTLVSSDATNDEIRTVSELFGSVGALVAASELPRVSAKIGGKHRFIGYVDIFNTTAFTVVLLDTGNVYREATLQEITDIKAGRVYTPKPKTVTSLFGVLEPTIFKKLPNAPVTNQLKLLGTDPKTTTSKGAACNTKTKAEIESYFVAAGIELTDADKNKIKEQQCFTLGISLFRKGRMFTYPEWKHKL